MRLKDADALIEKSTYLWDEALGTCRCVLTEDIENAPTIDAVHVVHGQWNGYVCSVCGVSSEYGSENYCPNCGARMDGE